MHQERNPATVSQLLTQILELQNKVNALSDAREFYDSETATHGPSQPSTFPSPRTTRSRDSGLAHDTRSIMGTSGNVFERPPAREGRTSTLFKKSKTLASSSQELRPGIPGNTKRPESEMRREPQNSSILVPRFQSGGGLLDHTGGTYSHHDMIGYPRFPTSAWHLGKILTPWNLKARKSISRLKCVQNQQILISQCTGSKKLGPQNQLTNLWHHDRFWSEQNFFDFEKLDAMIASVEETSQQARSLPKKSKCRRAARSKIRPILTRETNCLHDLRAFPCNRSLWRSTRTLSFV